MPDHPHASTNGCVCEHILVAEQKLGRYLKPGETVHHIDRNKRNNNPDNIIVFASNSDHISYHSGHTIYEKDGVWYATPKYYTCEFCGIKFTRKYSPKGNHVYCSYSCSTKATLRTNSFTKEELLDLLLYWNGNFTKAAESVNITDNALRKRCRKLNMPIHSIDYKLCF